MTTRRRQADRRAAQVAAALLLAGGPAGAAAVSAVTDLAVVRCLQPAAERLSCSYRVRGPADLDAIEAQLGNTPLPVTRTGTTTGAVALLLVDTSDPGRQDVVTANASQIGRLADAAGPDLRLGLARFDTNPHVLAVPGSPADAIRAAADGLRAVGMTTELYRNTLEAVRLLAADPAPLRALYVFSDGQAEDFAYRHEDAVEAALEHDVVIVGLGYARDVARSVALQTLRRLAEDTGGRYVEAAADHSLPEEFLAAPFAGIGLGGRFEVDLQGAIDGGRTGARQAVLTLRGPAGTASVEMPVSLPTAPLAPVMVVQAAAPVQAPVARGPVSPPPRSTIDTWLWYGTPAAFLLLVLIALAIFGRMWRRQATASAPPPAIVSGKPFAYLVRKDDPAGRMPILASPWRIGRGRNNDLVVDDHSISRQHAEIHRRHDGTFSIVDLDSLNGVFVNDKKVKQADIHEGDLVDVGDVGMKFTLYDDDPAAQEPTVMVHTRAPTER